MRLPETPGRLKRFPFGERMTMNVILLLCDTLRRDHVSAYTGGRPLNQCWSAEAPDWSVHTPNMDRVAKRGVTFTNGWCGSTPCMPARRDIYTGRYEFLERGWGPLEDDDIDLPRQISGPPNRSLTWSLQQGYRISNLITDHFHLWEKGAGNYHMGYSGFEFVRGCEGDALFTDPEPFPCPESDRLTMDERHWRNVHRLRKSEDDYFSAQVIDKACGWLDRNHTHENFFLNLDIFDPHEPFDPPQRLVKQFDPRGYDVPGVGARAWYSPWREKHTPEQFTNLRARYAAKVAFLDERLGRLFNTLDRLNLWDNTLVILTTDHGTFNGDHARTGKLQTHEHDAVGHIPFLMAYPGGQGEQRSQLVQLVDIFPTVLAAVHRPIPVMPEGKPLHGINLLPVLADPAAPTRDYAIAGQFGESVTLTDTQWILHQAPVPDNQPLYWYGHCLAKFMPAILGPYVRDRRHCTNKYWWKTPTWLSNKQTDPNELINLADREPTKLKEMQAALARTLRALSAPREQLQRLGLS